LKQQTDQLSPILVIFYHEYANWWQRGLPAGARVYNSALSVSSCLPISPCGKPPRADLLGTIQGRPSPDKRGLSVTGFFTLAPSQRHWQSKPASMKQRGRRTGDLFRGVKTGPVRPSPDTLPLSCLLSVTARRNPEHIARRREGTKVTNYGA
jgi:hypothetical protein